MGRRERGGHECKGAKFEREMDNYDQRRVEFEKGGVCYDPRGDEFERRMWEFDERLGGIWRFGRDRSSSRIEDQLYLCCQKFPAKSSVFFAVSPNFFPHFPSTSFTDSMGIAQTSNTYTRLEPKTS
ncbi:hypothetical protein M5K25_020509 [Dendrobium thyrsiflorum]|uniref:Uncharacterized protein n=1 Tax=Dendrobium thyrsiflorum TaxID=117978 RepID=A0ABD0UA58_DENTH